MAHYLTKLGSGVMSLIYFHTLNVYPEDANLDATTVLMIVDVQKATLGSII